MSLKDGFSSEDVITYCAFYVSHGGDAQPQFLC